MPVQTPASSTVSVGQATKASHLNSLRVDTIQALEAFDYGTAAQLPASPAIGDSFLVSDDDILYACFDAGSWKAMATQDYADSVDHDDRYYTETELDADQLTQYILVDGSRAFSGEIDAQAGLDISGGALKIGGSTVIDASENLSLTGTGTTQQLGGAGAKIGIGTAAPSYPLSIQYQFDRNDTTLRDLLRLQGDDGDTNSNSLLLQAKGNVAGASRYFSMQTRSGGAEQGMLLLQPRAGNVGIGTDAPTAQLHVLSGAADRVGLKVDSAASPSQPQQEWMLNGTELAELAISDLESYYWFKSRNLDAGTGPRFQAGRNNNGSTPAAGWLRIMDKGSQYYSIWPDDTGDLRIGTSLPTFANDASGTIVGDQGSWHETKDILGPALPAEDAVRSVADLVFDQFAYKETGYQQWDGSAPVFNGLVVRTRKDWWGKNMGPNQTPCLNEIELFGRYGLAIQKIIQEIQALGGFTWLQN